jgi:hypothetical protein
MKLIGKETYERRFSEEGADIDKQPLFYLKKLTVGEKAAIDDSVFAPDDKGNMKFLGGTSVRLKLKYALVDWKNVTDESGNVVLCNDESKDKLPGNVVLWLIEQIDELNGLRLVMSEEERKKFFRLD